MPSGNGRTRSQFLQTQGRIYLRPGGHQRAANSILGRLQAIGNRLPTCPQEGCGGGAVAPGGGGGAQRFSQDSATLALALERRQIDLPQRGCEEIVLEDRGEQGDVGVANR